MRLLKANLIMSITKLSVHFVSVLLIVFMTLQTQKIHPLETQREREREREGGGE